MQITESLPDVYQLGLSEQDLGDVHFSMIEGTLNVFGYIPVLRNYSGIVRMGIGVISLTHSIAQFIFHTRSQKEWNLLKREEVCRDFINITHAVANICRGVVESFIISLPLIISIASIFNWIRPTFRMRGDIIMSFVVIPIIYDIAGFRLKYPGEIKAFQRLNSQNLM